MCNLSSMQKKVDGLLSIFIKLIETLESNITELTNGIQRNKTAITALEEQNVAYSDKIAEYETLAANVKGFINKV